MKIKEIHIYGYGKLMNVQFPQFSSLQVIYGENEAGKSTLMAFIHGVLFGFPTKQQSDLRYEPKTHTNYGGSLTMDTDEYGVVVIERVKGKAIGDVTVKLADGTVGGEELLNKILNGIDKAMYQGIFSFNIHGLQGVNRLKGDEIGRYLFAAGTIGTDTIIKTEQQIQKEMDRLFKPNGRNPELNQMLQTLREQDKELKKSKQHNQAYDQLQQEQFQLEQEINLLQEKITIDQNRIQKLDQLIHEWPIYIERKQILQRLNELGEIHFPVDGLSRLDNLEEKLRSVTSQLNVLEERRKRLKEQLVDVTPKPLFEKNNTQIQMIIEKWPQVVQWQEDIIKLQTELEKWNEQIDHLQRQVHFDEDDLRQLSNVDLSIAMKDRLRSATKDYYSLKSQESELRKQSEKEKGRLAEIERQCEKIEASLLSEEEFRQLSENQQKYQQLERQQHYLKERVKLIGKEHGQEKSVQTLLLYGLFIGLFIWSFVAEQPIFMIGSLIGLVVLSISFWLAKKNRKSSNEQENLDKQEKQLLAELNKYKNLFASFEEQQRLRQEWKDAVIQLENQQIRYIETENDLKNWNFRWSKINNRLGELKHQLRLHENFSSEQLSDAFDILCELSRILQRKGNTRKQQHILKENQIEWHNKLEEQLKQLQIDGFANEEGFILLKNALKNEQERQHLSADFRYKLEEVLNEELKWKSEQASLQNTIAGLLEEANVHNHEEFRLKGKNHEEYGEHRKHLSIIEKKIDEDDLLVMESIHSLKQLEEEKDRLTDKMQSYSSLFETYHKKLAQVKYEIGILEEGGSFTERLHEFYHLRSLYNDQARTWAKLALAKEMLQKTMERLKEERFPKVLKTAENYVRILTNNEYVHLHFRDKSKLTVERKDRVIFEPEELSQATGEQVYVALRLALVQVLKIDYPFPIIIDDGFVNFDENRTKNIIKLLIEISKTTQVLFFTCHHHLLDLFPKEDILDLMDQEKSTLLN